MRHARNLNIRIYRIEPTAIEVVDGLVLERARNDSSWSSVMQAIGEISETTQSLLFIEFNHQNNEDIQATCEKLRGYAEHVEVLKEPTSIETVWNFRSRAVGLLSASETSEKPIPFVEDCGIPPQRLPWRLSAPCFSTHVSFSQ